MEQNTQIGDMPFELTPEELAVLAQKVEGTVVTTDDQDEETPTQEAPTLH